jgi:hypothetical protein
MELFRYYWGALKLAFVRSPGLAQDILFGLFVVVGGLLYLFKRLGMIQDIAPWMDQITGWQITAVVLTAIFVVRLLLAPYWLHQEQSKEIESLKSSLAATLPANLEIYSSVDPMPLTMASFLLCDQTPETKVDGNTNAHIMFERLVHAITQGEVLQYGWTNRQFAQMSYNATYGNTGVPVDNVPPINGKTRVSQSELLAFARRHGMKPIFLRAKFEAVAKEEDRDFSYRRKLIADARKMISILVKGDSGIPVAGSRRHSFKHKLTIEPAYLAIAPYLSEKFKKEVSSNEVFIAVGDASVVYEASAFMRELDRLEKEWDVGA